MGEYPHKHLMLDIETMNTNCYYIEPSLPTIYVMVYS